MLLEIRDKRVPCYVMTESLATQSPAVMWEGKKYEMDGVSKTLR